MPAEVDWSLLQHPDILGGSINAYTAGRALAKQQGVDQALQTYATNPTAGIQALNAFDPERGLALTTANQGQQDRAARIASATAYAQGDTGGAMGALAKTGDLQNLSVMQSESISRHMAQMQFAQQEASKIFAAGQGIPDPEQRKTAYLAAFDAEAPRYAQFAGASPADIAQLRQALVANPDVALKALMAPPEYGFQQVGDNDVMVMNKTTGQPVGHYQGTKFVTVPPANSVVQVGGGGGAPDQPQAVPGGAPPPAGPGGIKAAIIGQESGGNPNVGQSAQGAVGIGQIMPATFAQYAKPGESIDNPADNQAVSGRILDDYMKRYQGDAQRAAVAYFSGPGNVAPPGSPMPWVHNFTDATGTHVSDYVANVQRRMGGASPGAYQTASTITTGGPQVPGAQAVGATAAAAYRAAAPATAAQPQTSGGAKVVAQGPPAFGDPRPLPGAPGLWQRGADGQEHQVEGSGYKPEQIVALRDHVTSDDSYKQAQAALSAYQAMKANIDKMTGPSAYAILDTFARAINPGAIARPTVIQTLEEHVGIPARVIGALENLSGGGNLPPETRQQLLDAVLSFVDSHWEQANALNQGNADFAKRNGINPADITAPLGPRPERYVVGSAQAAVAPGMKPAAPFHGMSEPQRAAVQALSNPHGSPTGSPGNPYIPQSKAEYDTIPKGGHYVFTDGRIMVKP